MGELERLATRTAAVGGVDRIAAHAAQASVRDVGEQAAADAAVRALGPDRLHRGEPGRRPFPARVVPMNGV
jgi:hypothetical protein